MSTIETDVSRRKFLQVAVAGLATILLAACSPSETPPRLDLGKQRLNDELDKLPNSAIKSLLLARVKPFYGSSPLKSINYNGQEIKVYNPAVVLKTANTNEVRGEVTPRSSFLTSDPLFPTRETLIRVPYPGIVLDSEKATIPAGNLAKDGTPLVDVLFPTDRPFYEGLNPVITITTPDPSFIKPQFRQKYKNLERFVYIKEVCSLLLVDVLIQESVKRMHDLGLNITMEVRTPRGAKRPAEALIQSLVIINNTMGRFAASFDLAGYLVAFKATEGTEIDDPTNMDAGFLKVRPSMQTAVLGTSAKDILYNSLRWVLNTPEANQLAHVGNINLLP